MDFEKLKLVLRIRKLEQANDMLIPLVLMRLAPTNSHGLRFADTRRRN